MAPGQFRHLLSAHGGNAGPKRHRASIQFLCASLAFADHPLGPSSGVASIACLRLFVSRGRTSESSLESHQFHLAVLYLLHLIPPVRHLARVASVAVFLARSFEARHDGSCFAGHRAENHRTASQGVSRPPHPKFRESDVPAPVLPCEKVMLRLFAYLTTPRTPSLPA
jgi:hypothetical protein